MKRLAILTAFGMILMSNVWGTIATGVVTTTSNDWSGYTVGLSSYPTFNATFDSTSPGNGVVRPIGMSGGLAYNRLIRVSLSIPQGATIDSAEHWVVSGCNACTDTLQVREFVVDADNYGQVTDTAGFRAAYVAISSASGATDTAILSTTTSWGVGAKVRLPFNKLKSLIQVPISRAGWSSGNYIVLLQSPTAASPTNNRATRMFDYSSGTTYDSIWVSYTASGGGSPSSAVNLVVRQTTLQELQVRAPEKLFYRQKDNWRW